MFDENSLCFFGSFFPIRQLPVSLAGCPEVDVFGGEFFLEKFLKRERGKNKCIWIMNITSFTNEPKTCADPRYLPAAFQTMCPMMPPLVERHLQQCWWRSFAVHLSLLPRQRRPCCMGCIRSSSNCNHHRWIWCTHHFRTLPTMTAFYGRTPAYVVLPNGIAAKIGPIDGMVMRCG